MTLTTFLFSARGRIRRRDWWIFTVGFGVCAGLIEFGLLASGQGFQKLATLGPVFITPLSCLILFISTIAQWPIFCVNAKRLQDRGRPNALGLVTPALALINLTAFVNLMPAGLFLPMSGVGMVWGLAMLVICGILPGQPGDNQYGPPPGTSPVHAVF